MGSIFRFCVGLVIMCIFIGAFIYSGDVGEYEVGMRWVVAFIAFCVGTILGMFLIANNQ